MLKIIGQIDPASFVNNFACAGIQCDQSCESEHHGDQRRARTDRLLVAAAPTDVTTPFMSPEWPLLVQPTSWTVSAFPLQRGHHFAQPAER